MKISIKYEQGRPVLEMDEQILRDAGFDETKVLEASVQSGRIIIETAEGRQASFEDAKAFLFEHYGETLARLAE